MHRSALRGVVVTVFTLALAIAPSVAFAAAAPAARAEEVSPLQAALANVLDPDTTRGKARLSRSDIDATGDATVIFAIHDIDDDAELTRAGALSDTLALLQAAYQSPAAGGMRSLTVLGTFPFKGTKGRAVREFPVLRAVLSADRAALLSWDRLGAADVPGAVDVWWLQEAFANVGTPPPETVQADTDLPSTDSDESSMLARILPRLTIALAHLTESVNALSAGERGIGRSQFKQFFDAWDDVDKEVRELNPSAYEVLDDDLQRAEIALFHTLPENMPVAHGALRNVRDDLVQIMSGNATLD